MLENFWVKSTSQECFLEWREYNGNLNSSSQHIQGRGGKDMACAPKASNEKENERCKYEKNQNVFLRQRGEYVLPRGDMFQGAHRTHCGLSRHKGAVCHLFSNSHFHSKMTENQKPNQEKDDSAQNKRPLHNFNIPNASEPSRCMLPKNGRRRVLMKVIAPSKKRTGL